MDGDLHGAVVLNRAGVGSDGDEPPLVTIAALFRKTIARADRLEREVAVLRGRLTDTERRLLAAERQQRDALDAMTARLDRTVLAAATAPLRAVRRDA